MDKATSQLSLYDHLAYIFVGGSGLILIALNAKYLFGKPTPDIDLGDAAVALIISYFFGHVVQAVANLFGKLPVLKKVFGEDKKSFSPRDKEILIEVRKYLDIEGEDPVIFRVCSILATTKDETGQIKSTNANYSLYRGWFLLFLVQSIFLVYITWISYSVSKIWLLIASIIISILMYLRAKRFWSYFREKVLDTFLVLRKFN